MIENYLAEALRKVLQQVPFMGSFHINDFRLVSSGMMSKKDIKMNYFIRHQNLKEKGFSLYGYEDLVANAESLPEERNIEFNHFKRNHLVVSIFLHDQKMIGYFYFDSTNPDFLR